MIHIPLFMIALNIHFIFHQNMNILPYWDYFMVKSSYVAIESDDSRSKKKQPEEKLKPRCYKPVNLFSMNQCDDCGKCHDAQ